MSINVDNFREEAPKFLFSKLSTGRNALLDAPPGLGKTRNAAKVAIRLVKESGQRVLIIEPTKTLRKIVADYIKEEDEKIKFHISKGNDDYICPLTGTKANLCSERKDQCKIEKKTCDVISDNEKCLNSSLTIATFPKLLLSKSLFKGYNTILIDESHGFENAENNYLQTYVMLSKLLEAAKSLKSENPQLAEKLENLYKGLSTISDMLGDSSPLTLAEVDNIRNEFSDTLLRDSWLAFTRENKQPGFNILYRNISNLRYQMQSINNNVFFFYIGSLYGRPKNMEVEISSFFKEKNVGLLSATIDDPIKHAKTCGLDMRRFSPNDAEILRGYSDIRRNNRKLIALSDGPFLGRSEEQYDDSRQQANEIISQMVTKYQVRTLVLFRGYNDQKLAGEYLEKQNITGRIHHVLRGDDPETIEAKLKKLKESDIVLCSAAARLWEGIDVPNLCLLIIDALPYPSKDPLDSEYDFRASHISMIKKLKQGLGRIVRSDDDWGIAVVIDRRFCDKFKSLSKSLPWFMGDDFKTLSTNNALEEINDFIAKRLIG